jgi:hypothetical protein
MLRNIESPALYRIDSVLFIESQLVSIFFIIRQQLSWYYSFIFLINLMQVTEIKDSYFFILLRIYLLEYLRLLFLLRFLRFFLILFDQLYVKLLPLFLFLVFIILQVSVYFYYLNCYLAEDYLIAIGFNYFL